MGVYKSAIIHPYNHHLLEFERAMAGGSHTWLQRVSSPLRLSEWSYELEGHPDAVLATHVLNGIHNGFHIGFDRSKRCKPSRSNMKSALGGGRPIPGRGSETWPDSRANPTGTRYWQHITASTSASTGQSAASHPGRT